jgi:hypothetical protein
MRLRAALLSIVFALAPSQHAAAWGVGGHSVIAEIAQRRLPPEVRRAIRDLLVGDVSLASIAAWADHVALLIPSTAHWHFVNIPYDATGYDAERDCRQTEKGDCIINAIARAQAGLIDRSATRESRAEALKFLVHLVGDVHQPLHTIDRHDEGGNQFAVTFFDKPMSLHAVWDFGIIERYSFDWGEYVERIEATWLPGKPVHALQAGTAVDWAWEAHRAAVDVAYVVPEDLKLGDAYYQRALPVVDRQLALAGIRLARLLNEALASPSRPAQ